MHGDWAVGPGPRHSELKGSGLSGLGFTALGV